MAFMAEDTYALVRKIEERRAPMPFYASRYFPDIMQFDSEEVHFDYVLGERRMAPFVSPLVEGVAMRDKGFTMKSFRPAYVKPKHVVDPTKPLKRVAGEPFGGALSPSARMDAKVAENMMKEDEMITNRIEWMCLQILKEGALTVAGENYPTQVVDYGRDADNKATLAAAARWNDSTPMPLSDLEDMSTHMAKADFGAPAQDIVMDADAYKEFRKNADVKDLLDTNYRGSAAVVNREPTTFDPEMSPTLMGRVGSFDIYVDSRQYMDDTGAIVPYLDSGDVLLLSRAIEGVQAFGAILDVDAMIPLARYPKTWTTEDPSVRYTMTQSAPLPVAQRINACGYIQAFG